MRVRGAVTLCLLILAATAATALAASTYKGHLNGHSTQKVSFVRSGATVTSFTLTNVRAPCDDGYHHLNPSYTTSAPIDAVGHFKATGGPVTFKGTLDNHEASGKLIIDGSFSGSAQNCTLDRKWTAAH
jgi:hypothetical protein